MQKPACLKAVAEPLHSEDDEAHAQERNPMPDRAFRAEVAAASARQPEPLTQAARQTQARRDRKQARYALVCTLHAEGLALREIGRRLQMPYRMVRKYLQAVRCPFYPAQVKRSHSKLAPFLGYLTAQWQARGPQCIPTL